MKLDDIHALAETLPVRHLHREDGAIYLSRYKIHGWMPTDQVVTPCSVYLHHIREADSDEAMHSHPWAWSQTTILWGGYREERGVLMPDGEIVRHPEASLFMGAGRYMTAGNVHRIASVLPDTWTLFMVGPKLSSWGFYVEGRGMVPWRERLAERGITPDHPPAEHELRSSTSGEAAAS